MLERPERRMGFPINLILPAILIAAFTVCTVHAGQLNAGALLLIYNTADKDSRELAEYYAGVRGVPKDQLLGLTLREQGEQITPEEYVRAIRDPIRSYLEKNNLQKQVRCLVSFYGLPIRVTAPTQTAAGAKLLEKWRGEVQTNLDEFQQVIGELNPAATRPSRKDPKPPDLEVQYLNLQQDYMRAANGVLERLRTKPGPDAEELTRKLFGSLQKVQGLVGLLAQPGMQPEAPGTTPAQLRANIEQALKEKQQRIQAIMQKGLVDPGRDEARRLLREVGGLNGVLESYQSDINTLRVDETVAAVDSELALLWWSDYAKYRWIPNTNSWRFRARLAAQHQALPENGPVLMVSRIDGPTAALAKGLIDKALAAEKNGISGTVYLDARGIKGTDSYGEYDTYLRQLADDLRKMPALKVQLDNKPALFQPGKCPETMLYCGWDSLRKNVDAFEFVPGAVGYHMASLEAVSLKRPGEEGWCARMISKGITATLGAVDEPYLHSFPRPDDFFKLLLTGRLTLVEVWDATVPLHSWRMMLIGDPLYRPFAAHPFLTLQQAVPPDVIPPEYRAATAPAGR